MNNRDMAISLIKDTFDPEFTGNCSVEIILPEDILGVRATALKETHPYFSRFVYQDIFYPDFSNLYYDVQNPPRDRSKPVMQRHKENAQAEEDFISSVRLTNPNILQDRLGFANFSYGDFNYSVMSVADYYVVIQDDLSYDEAILISMKWVKKD